VPVPEEEADLAWARAGLAHYDVPVERWTPMGWGRVRIDGGGRCYEARRLGDAAARWRTAVTDVCAGRGFRRTQRPLATLYLERWVRLADGSAVLLVDVFAGHPLEPVPQDVDAAARNLGRLHRALDGAGAHPDLHDLPARRGSWVDHLRAGRDALAAERLLAGDRSEPARATGPLTGPATGGRTWMAWLDRWAETADRAVAALERSGYAERAGEAARRREIAWNGYRLQNLVRTRGGRIATLQLVDPVADARLFDLATLCHEVCLGGHAGGVAEALSAYRAEAPLDADEADMVRAFAAFPHHAVQWLRTWRAARGATGLPPGWERMAARHQQAAGALL
jgi:Ser/Thr protein kinase RdoA (MazF antagonist)